MSDKGLEVRGCRVGCRDHLVEEANAVEIHRGYPIDLAEPHDRDRKIVEVAPTD